MSLDAQIVADSINPTGNRMTTYVLKYWRAIHSEVLTHRAFSRNSASSRAVPVEKMIQRIIDDPFIPTHWTINGPGMVASVEATDPVDIAIYMQQWLRARDVAVEEARWFSAAKLHKQVVNRLLEPWMHIEVVLSGTEFNNFFLLRDHKDAEPHLRDLAALMHEQYSKSEPISRGMLEASTCQYAGKLDPLSVVDSSHRFWWHKPFVREDTFFNRTDDLHDLIKESVAHCAWVSYYNQFQEATPENVERVYQRLVGSQPIHASPTEHVAVACNGPHRHGNFVGWCPWRKFLPGESGGDYVSAA